MRTEQQSAEYSDDAIWAVLRIDAVASVAGAALGAFVVEGGAVTAMTVGVLIANIAVLAGVALYGVSGAVWRMAGAGETEADETADAGDLADEPERMAA